LTRGAGPYVAVAILITSIIAFRGVAFDATDALPTMLTSVAQAEALQARIDRAAAALAKVLTPVGRKAYLTSIQRLHDYAAAHCGYYDGQKKLQPGESTCLLNIQGNFLDSLPRSVYRVGNWRVYETGVYAIEWADDELLGQDTDVAFWWDMEVTWPRVDADPSPVPTRAMTALTQHVHERIASWATAGWSLSVQVRFEAINECYASASITESDYGGGAHPYENLTGFTWDLRAVRQLQLADLFLPDRNWRAGLLELYRNHLASGSAAAALKELDDDSLALSLGDGWLVTDKGLRLLNREGSTRIERLPDVELTWNELAQGLSPSAACRVS